MVELLYLNKVTFLLGETNLK